MRKPGCGEARLRFRVTQHVTSHSVCHIGQFLRTLQYQNISIYRDTIGLRVSSGLINSVHVIITQNNTTSVLYPNVKYFRVSGPVYVY